MNTRRFSIKEVKQMDMVAYLEKLGHTPDKIRGNDYWYLSPLRTEKTASFKVNKSMNAWYDHGTGEGGNLLDFGIRYFDCTVKEFLKRMAEENLSVSPAVVNDAEMNIEPRQPKIKILEVKDISNPGLLFYLKERRIPRDLAFQYCKEVHYELYSEQFFAIGFKNNSGGYELRNPHFKASSSPKDVTFILTAGAKKLTVIEGFFSFLSYQTIFRNQPQPLTDFLVLNSLSFAAVYADKMQEYKEVHLLLDNDPAGDKATAALQNLSPVFRDGRDLFKGYKDLNHWLTGTGKPKPVTLKQ